MDNKIFTKIPVSKKLFGSTNEFSFSLKPSSLGGVGVFANHGIKKGTRLSLFYSNVRILKKNKVKGNLKKFCLFFGVETKNEYHIPRNFGRMDIGWYLNHCDSFNAIHDKYYRYFASKDIQSGEEVTINYSDL